MVTEKKWYHINKSFIPIKSTFFVFQFGFGLIWWFMVPQMRHLGLSYVDISLIFAITPLVTMFTTPLLGLIADHTGYKMVLIFDILLMIASSTTFVHLPRYIVQQQTPMATIQPGSSGEHHILDIKWPMSCERDTSVNRESCANDWSLNEENILASLPEWITDCDGATDFSHNWDNITVSVTQTDNNGTMCLATEANTTLPDNNVQFNCPVNNTLSGLGTCQMETQSLSFIFWTYTFLRLLFEVSMQSAFTVLDGLSVTILKAQDGNYAHLLTIMLFSAAIAGLLGGNLVQDQALDHPYKYQAFGGDICYVISIAILIFMKVPKNNVKSDGSFFKDFHHLLKKPVLLFLAVLLLKGLVTGVVITYLIGYLQEELQASPTFIGYYAFIGTVCGILGTLVPKAMVEKVGSMNIIFLGTIHSGVNLLIYSLLRLSPPYHALWLHALEYSLGSQFWIACITHGCSLVPGNMAGTMSSMIAVMLFMLGKSIGAFFGGQLESWFQLAIPQIFQIQASVTIVGAVLLYLVYFFCGRANERKLLEEWAAAEKKPQKPQEDKELAI